MKHNARVFEMASPFALVTRRPYCPRRLKKLCFTTASLAPMISTARLGVVKQSSFGLPGQYGRRVTRANRGSGIKEIGNIHECFKCCRQVCCYEKLYCYGDLPCYHNTVDDFKIKV